MDALQILEETGWEYRRIEVLLRVVGIQEVLYGWIFPTPCFQKPKSVG
jgi:hypothetical protein